MPNLSPSAAPPLADVVARLRELVAFDTTSRNSNVALIDDVAARLDRPGVTVHRHPTADGSKANLVAVVGPPLDGSREGLVLAGHVDTVPAEEPEWTGDPFTLRERDGQLVARGAADMKGFCAVALALAASVDPASLRHPLVVVLTHDEELGGLGAARLVDTWPDARRLPRSAVIGEPTELAVVRLHKGHLKLRVTIPGRSAHSAYPHLGDNAIARAGEVIRALNALGGELATERVAASVHFPDAPSPTLNLGTIRGGSAINVVADRCVLEVGVRILPGMDDAAVEQRVARAIAAAAPAATLERVSGLPAMACPEDAPIHRALCGLVGQTASQAVHYATDGGELQRAGIQCVVWGPGSIEVAHRPDESVSIAHLERCGEVLAALVARFCR